MTESDHDRLVGCLTCNMAFPPEAFDGGCPGCEALRDAGAL